MVHHDHRSDGADPALGDSAPGVSGQDQPDTPDSVPGHTHILDGSVDAGWLRPRAPRHLGRPRVSTILLLIIWIALLVLYLEVHTG